MVGESKEEVGKSCHKGVNVTEIFSARRNICSSDTESLTTTGPIKSVSRVKQDLQTVIDLMGPNTPHFTHNTSSEADNEESVFTGTTQKSSKSKSKSKTDEESSYMCSVISNPHPLLESNAEETDCSVLADKATSYSGTFENHNEAYCSMYAPYNPEPNFGVHPLCGCGHQSNGGWPQNFGGQGDNANEKDEQKFKVDRNPFYQWFKNLTGKSKMEVNRCEFYRMNVKTSSGQNPPKRLVFDLVEDVPVCHMNAGPPAYHAVEDHEDIYEENNYCRPKSNRTKELKNMRNEITSQQGIRLGTSSEVGCPNDQTLEKYDNQLPDKVVMASGGVGSTRVDVYYFDHGNASYLRTTDSPPIVMSELIAEKTEQYTTKFWASIFGTAHIGLALIASFILQFFRFLLYGFIRPVTIGLVQLASDYCYKPSLATLFNAVVQPPLIFLYNVATSIRDICEPIAEGIGYFLREIAVVLRAFRFVEVKSDRKYNGACTCRCEG